MAAIDGITSPALLVVGGAPGVGKSTLCARLADEHGKALRVVSADAPAGTARDAQPASWIPAFHRALRRAVRASTPLVIADTTALIDGERTRLLAHAAAGNRPAHLLLLDAPPGLCRARVATRGSADRPPLPPARLEDYLTAHAACCANISALAEEGWASVQVVAHADCAALRLTLS